MEVYHSSRGKIARGLFAQHISPAEIYSKQTLGQATSRQIADAAVVSPRDK